MVGITGDDDMSSSERNAGFRLLRGEGDLFNRGLLTKGWLRQGGDEKLSVDSDQARLRATVRLSGRLRSGGRVTQGGIFFAQGCVGR